MRLHNERILENIKELEAPMKDTHPYWGGLQVKGDPEVMSALGFRKTIEGKDYNTWGNKKIKIETYQERKETFIKAMFQKQNKQTKADTNPKMDKEVKKMGSESQSRYGIMEELNNRKIAQKEKLANIERDADNHVFEEEKKVNVLQQKIKDKGSTYQMEFKDRQRTRNVQLDLIEGEYKRAKEDLEDAMKDDKDNYQDRFIEWKKAQELAITSLNSDLTRYNDVINKKIKEKQDIIAETENGIKSLKEISSEQKEEKK